MLSGVLDLLFVTCSRVQCMCTERSWMRHSSQKQHPHCKSKVTWEVHQDFFPGVTCWNMGALGRTRAHSQCKSLTENLIQCSLEIVQSQNNLVWKLPLEVSSPTSWSKHGQLRAQTRLLRALPCWELKGPWGWRLPSLSGSLPHSLTGRVGPASWAREFSLYAAWTSLASTYVSCLSFSHCWRA